MIIKSYNPIAVVSELLAANVIARKSTNNV